MQWLGTSTKLSTESWITQIVVPAAIHTTTTAKMRFTADAIPHYLDWRSRPPEPARDRNRELQTRGARDVTSSHTFRIFQSAKFVSVILQESHTVTDEAAEASEDSLTVLVAVDDQTDKIMSIAVGELTQGPDPNADRCMLQILAILGCVLPRRCTLQENRQSKHFRSG